MAFENIERRFQRWKVIMVPGAKSYYRRDSPASRITPSFFLTIVISQDNYQEESDAESHTGRSRNRRRFRWFCSSGTTQAKIIIPEAFHYESSSTDHYRKRAKP